MHCSHTPYTKADGPYSSESRGRKPSQRSVPAFYPTDWRSSGVLLGPVPTGSIIGALVIGKPRSPRSTCERTHATLKARRASGYRTCLHLLQRSSASGITPHFRPQSPCILLQATLMITTMEPAPTSPAPPTEDRVRDMLERGAPLFVPALQAMCQQHQFTQPLIGPKELAELKAAAQLEDVERRLSSQAVTRLREQATALIERARLREHTVARLHRAALWDGLACILSRADMGAGPEAAVPIPMDVAQGFYSKHFMLHALALLDPRRAEWSEQLKELLLLSGLDARKAEGMAVFIRRKIELPDGGADFALTIALLGIEWRVRSMDPHVKALLPELHKELPFSGAFPSLEVESGSDTEDFFTSLLTTPGKPASSGGGFATSVQELASVAATGKSLQVSFDPEVVDMTGGAATSGAEPGTAKRSRAVREAPAPAPPSSSVAEEHAQRFAAFEQYEQHKRQRKMERRSFGLQRNFAIKPGTPEYDKHPFMRRSEDALVESLYVRSPMTDFFEGFDPAQALQQGRQIVLASHKAQVSKLARDACTFAPYAFNDPEMLETWLLEREEVLDTMPDKTRSDVEEARKELRSFRALFKEKRNAPGTNIHCLLAYCAVQWFYRAVSGDRECLKEFDEDLWSTLLRNKVAEHCTICRGIGHLSGKCPEKESASKLEPARGSGGSGGQGGRRGSHGRPLPHGSHDRKDYAAAARRSPPAERKRDQEEGRKGKQGNGRGGGAQPRRDRERSQDRHQAHQRKGGQA